MGYTFGKPYSAPPRACSAPPSRTITSKPFPYQHQYPSVSKPRHDLSAPVIPTSSTVDHHPSGHNHPSPICLPLVGPVFPLLPPLSLMDVGCSSILSHSLYLVWRIFLLFFTLLLFIFIVLCNPSHLRFLPGVAVLLSVLSAVLMFHRCMSYRFNSNNHLALTERRASFSYVNIFFNIHFHSTHSAPFCCLTLNICTLYLIDVTPLCFRLQFICVLSPPLFYHCPQFIQVPNHY